MNTTFTTENICTTHVSNCRILCTWCAQGWRAQRRGITTGGNSCITPRSQHESRLVVVQDFEYRSNLITYFFESSLWKWPKTQIQNLSLSITFIQIITDWKILLHRFKGLVLNLLLKFIDTIYIMIVFGKQFMSFLVIPCRVTQTQKLILAYFRSILGYNSWKLRLNSIHVVPLDFNYGWNPN
jgi:hypothetical protein